MKKNLKVDYFGEAHGIHYKKMFPIGKAILIYIFETDHHKLMGFLAMRTSYESLYRNESPIALYDFYTVDGELIAPEVSEAYMDSKFIANMENRRKKYEE